MRKEYMRSRKVEAIRKAPAPVNQHQLRSFLGMINYYSKFISNYSTITYPLNELLKDGVQWKWSTEQQKSFNQHKDKLSSAPVLTHYNEKLALKLDTDASQYGIGVVILHILPSGKEKRLPMLRVRYPKASVITRRSKRKHSALFSDWRNFTNTCTEENFF